MTWSVVHEIMATVEMPSRWYILARLVLDPGDHPLDPEVLVRDASGEDVPVVTARHSGRRRPPVDAGLDERVTVSNRSMIFSPEKRSPHRRNASLSLSTTVHPFQLLRLTANSRFDAAPQPTTTTCTAFSTNDARCYRRRNDGPQITPGRILGDVRPMMLAARERGDRGGSEGRGLRQASPGRRPLATTEMEHQRIPKTIVPVFSSDAILVDRVCDRGDPLRRRDRRIEPRARAQRAGADRHLVVVPLLDRHHVVPPDDLPRRWSGGGSYVVSRENWAKTRR